MPGPVTATPDGDHLLVAEAGVLAVIDTAAGPGDPDYQNPRLDPISSHAVRAVDLMMDPGARLYTPFSFKDVVYIAGGRLGLWGMQAHPTGGSAFAVRLDDASDANDLLGQSSTRYCNDLARITVGPRDYLLALFAQRNSNRVRAYEIVDLRARVDAGAQAGQELGHELIATVEVCLDVHDDQLPDPWRPSFGLGMAVDGTDVYVALGQQGLVRIDFSQPPGEQCPSTNVVAGPYFGNQSAYVGLCGGLYGDFNYTDGTEVIYSHAPYFMDVAVEQSGAARYLWVALDHLGIAAFDITDPLSWAPDMPIDHQEGQSTTLGNGQKVIRLFNDPLPEAAPVRTYAHELRIAETNVGTQVRPALAVAVSKDPFARANGLRSEGRALDQFGKEVPNNPDGTSTEGTDEYTVVYDLVGLSHSPGCGSTNPGCFLREGGRGLHLQENQPPGQLVVYGGRVTRPKQQPNLGSNMHTTFRAVFDGWPSPPNPVHVERRVAADRPGRLAYDISYSPTNPEVLYTGSNDSELPPDGILVHCPSGIWRDYEPETNGDDERGTFGIIWHPFAVWQSAASDFAFGNSIPPGAGPKPRWMLVDLNPGANLCSGPLTEPDRRARIFIESPPDRFGSTGRGYYGGGEVNLDYDQANEPAPGLPIVFASRVDTPDGIVVLDRGLFEDRLVSGPNEALYDPEAIPGAVLGSLDTHPEFANIQDPLGLSTLDEDFIVQHGLRGRVSTVFPILIDIPEPSEPSHWMLAVPSLAVQLPDDLPVFAIESGWLPDDVYIVNYDHSMIRVFDVQDRGPILDPSNDPVSYTLLGPRIGTTAFRLGTATRTVGADNRTYLFATDVLGGVAVWDLTDLRGEADGEVIHPGHARYSDYFIEEWRSPGGAWDEFENNVWSMAIDNAQWFDGEQERDEIYVYVAVGRVGIEVLRFMPTNAIGQRLEWVRHIETPYGTGGLRVREDLVGVRTLLFSESQAGLRIFSYGG